MAGAIKKIVSMFSRDITPGQEVVPSENIAPIMKMTEEIANNMLIFQCKCGNRHFRHAGYMHTAFPWVKTSADEPEGKVSNDQKTVMVCTDCKTPFVWNDGKFWDMTGFIDVKIWEKTEVELNKATGPGGEC
jgi:hypothetical protein